MIDRKINYSTILKITLAFKYPSIKSKNSFYCRLQKVNFDEVKKNRILRFVNTHSHEDHIGAPEHDPSILTETPAVLSEFIIMLLINS